MMEIKRIASVCLVRVIACRCSQLQSRCYSTRELLPAVFPPWADSLLVTQPGRAELLRLHHIDAELSTDSQSTQPITQQGPRTQGVRQPQLRSSSITSARHHAQLVVRVNFNRFIVSTHCHFRFDNSFSRIIFKT